jgi:hypothetical protein
VIVQPEQLGGVAPQHAPGSTVAVIGAATSASRWSRAGASPSMVSRRIELDESNEGIG